MNLWVNQRPNFHYSSFSFVCFDSHLKWLDLSTSNSGNDLPKVLLKNVIGQLVWVFQNEVVHKQLCFQYHFLDKTWYCLDLLQGVGFFRGLSIEACKRNGNSISLIICCLASSLYVLFFCVYYIKSIFSHGTFMQISLWDIKNTSSVSFYQFFLKFGHIRLLCYHWIGYFLTLRVSLEQWIAPLQGK